MTDQACAQRDAATECAPAGPGLGLDDEFAGGIFEHADADVVVGQAGFELFRDFRQHFVGIQGGDSVSRNRVQQGEMTRLGALFVEKARVFDGDTRFAGEHAHQLQMPLIKRALVIGKNGHGADGVVIRYERHAAVATAVAERIHAEFFGFHDIVIADEHRLPCTDDVFSNVVAGGPAAWRLGCAADDLQIELHLIAKRFQRGDVKVLDIKKAAQLLPNLAEELFLIESGAEGAANFVEDVKLFGSAGSLLDEVAVFNGHADLMAKREQEAVFRRCETPAVRGAKEQNAEGLLLSLKADGHNAAEALRKGELPEAPDRLFALKRRDGIVIPQIAESQKPAESRDESDEIIIKALFLRGAAEVIAQAGGNDRSRTLRIAVMQEKRARGKSHDAEDAVQSLRQHALNFAADKAGGRQVQVGESEHVALDAALLFFVEGHDHQHGHESGRHGGGSLKTDVAEPRSGPEKSEGKLNGGPDRERNGEKPVGEGFLPTALLPEEIANPQKEGGRGKDHRKVEPVQRVSASPNYQHSASAGGRECPEFALSVELSSQKEQDSRSRIEQLIECGLERPSVIIERKYRTEIAEGDDGPAGCPIKEIRAALEAVNVGEESRHK